MVTFTRFLVGDPSTSPNPLFTLQEVKDAINQRYLELRGLAGMFGIGDTIKRAVLTGVDASNGNPESAFYTLAADVVAIEMVEVSDNGTNLSSTTTADKEILFLENLPYHIAWEGFQNGTITKIKYWTWDNQKLGIFAPLGAAQAGTGTVRYTYRSSVTELSADGDEPGFPRDYHGVICYGAAIVLRMSRELPVPQEMLLKEAEMRRQMMMALQGRAVSPGFQSSVAGLVLQTGIETRTGKTKRTND